jgi:hypothetical protein
MSTDIMIDCLQSDPFDPDKKKKCLDDFINDGCNMVNKYYDKFKTQIPQDQFDSMKQKIIDYSKNFNENNDALTTIYISKTNCTINAINRIFELTGDQALKPLNMQNISNKLSAIRENYKADPSPSDKNPPDSKKTIMNIILVIGILLVIGLLFLKFYK